MPAPRQLPRRRWSLSAYEGLSALTDRVDGTPVAALDWDETCVCGDISYALLDDLDASSPEDLWAHYGELIQRDRLLAYKALAVLLMQGKTRDEVRDWTRSVFERSLQTGRIRRVPEIADLVAHLHREGWAVWVVTGSPTEVVATLAPDIGVPEERVIGMEPVVGDDGRYGDRLHEPVTWREGKADLLAARAGRAPALAIGDSEGDIALMRSAAHAIWIDRGDPELEQAASSSGWWRQEAWT